jgi:hypothetical protein
MLYKFKSKAAGDVIMMQETGDELMRILGREPARKGIVEVASMPEAIVRIQAAIASAEQPQDDAADEGKPRKVGLRQRLWPMVEMIKRAQAAREPIVWGV